jgi:biotin carboxylase
VPFDRPYVIPSDYDPKLALAMVWGDNMQEAQERAQLFLEQVQIEGTDSKGEPIVTNTTYLENNLDRLLTF